MQYGTSMLAGESGAALDVSAVQSFLDEASTKQCDSVVLLASNGTVATFFANPEKHNGYRALIDGTEPGGYKDLGTALEKWRGLTGDAKPEVFIDFSRFDRSAAPVVHNDYADRAKALEEARQRDREMIRLGRDAARVELYLWEFSENRKKEIVWQGDALQRVTTARDLMGSALESLDENMLREAFGVAGAAIKHTRTTCKTSGRLELETKLVAAQHWCEEHGIGIERTPPRQTRGLGGR